LIPIQGYSDEVAGIVKFATRLFEPHDFAKTAQIYLPAMLGAERDHELNRAADRKIYVGCEQDAARTDVPRQCTVGNKAGSGPRDPNGQVQLETGSLALFNHVYRLI